MVLTQWQVADPDPATQAGLTAELSLSPMLCQVLINRDITDAAAARTFLAPSLHDLHDPFQLLGMDTAVRRIVAAVQQGEQMTVYGGLRR